MLKQIPPLKKLVRSRDNLWLENKVLLLEKEKLLAELDKARIALKASLRDSAELKKEYEHERGRWAEKRQSLTNQRDTVLTERAFFSDERDRLLVERKFLTGEREGLLVEREQLTAQRDQIASECEILRESLSKAELNLTLATKQRLIVENEERPDPNENERLLQDVPLKEFSSINLGCGGQLLDGWLNCDWDDSKSRGYTPAQHLLNIDLRLGLPLPQNSVDFIYSSHFLEHLTYEECLRLLQDCHAALRPGGTLRTVLPDQQKFMRAYCLNDKEFLADAVAGGMLDHMPEEQRYFADLLSRSIFEFYTHKYVYDFENFSQLLSRAGFKRNELSHFKDGVDSSHPLRLKYSFYMEAIKD